MKLDKLDVLRLLKDWETLEELEKELGMSKDEIINNLRKKVSV